MSDPEDARSSQAPFPTTRWSRVAAAGDPVDPGSRAAPGGHAEAGQPGRFEALRATLGGGRGTPHAEVAARLGTTEAAVEAAARRLRRRYREVLRERIAATLEDPTEAAIDAEIGDLFAALEG